MSWYRTGFLAALALLSGVLSAQEAVGVILSIDGYAEIDAFGQGQFIQAREGDRLYEASKIWTDYDSWVTIEIDEATFEVAPNSTSRIETFTSDRRQSGGPGILARLIRGLADALAPPPEVEQSFGTARASEAQTAPSGGFFLLDVDPDEAFALGQEALEAGDFRGAVEHLRAIELPENGSFPLEEYYVSTTWALMGLGDFDAALQTAFDFNADQPEPRAVPALPPRLKLLVGLSAFYGGDDALARSASLAYLEESGTATVEPEIVAVAIISSRPTDPEGAAALESQVRAQRPEIPWDELLE